MKLKIKISREVIARGAARRGVAFTYVNFSSYHVINEEIFGLVRFFSLLETNFSEHRTSGT